MGVMAVRDSRTLRFCAPAWVCALALALCPVAANAQVQQQGAVAALQAQDLRLASIAERILAANAPLCSETMPLAGLVLHSEDQYSGGQAGALFANGRLAIAAIVPGSPAAQAGLLAGDAITSVNGLATTALERADEAPLRDALFALLADQPAGTELVIGISRADVARTVRLQPPAGCRVLVEIITGNGLVGRSDGRVIQVSYELAALLDDDGLAVIFAHELAHAVLHHRRRLEQAGVSKGLLGEFGRNQQLNRRVEVEADRLSAHLLANAGYDPQIAPTFWNSATGRQAGGGLLRSFIYPAPTARGDLIAEEIANYLPLGRGPSWPGHLLALRDEPF